ncbi:MAG: hypothetical protein AAF724_04740 [Pseudomonadota bacterium]
MEVENKTTIPWPQEYAELEERLLAELGKDSHIYIHRAISEGKSGACVLVADVTSDLFTGQAILKLDRAVGAKVNEDMEYERHQHAIEMAPEYAAQYLPKLVCAVQQDNEVAALTTIAARGLEYAAAWSACSYGPQLETAVRLSEDLLEQWNAKYSLDPEMRMPQDLIDSWLDYRIDADRGGRIHAFLETKCKLPPETPTFTYDGNWYPNPLAFAKRNITLPTTARLRAVRGNQHGDLHGKNVLVTKQFEGNPNYFLIDLDFYRDDGFLLYDHAIFELDYLLTSRDIIKPANWTTLLRNLRRNRTGRNDAGLTGGDIGILQLVLDFREQPTKWIDKHEPNRLSFLDSQYLLARLGAGLAITHQRREDVKRAMAFLYAANNLKDYLALHEFDWPKHGPEFGLDELARNGAVTASGDRLAGADNSDQLSGNLPRPPKRSLAVLPLSGAGDTGYDPESLRDRLVTELSRIDWISTIGGPSTSAYRNKDSDPQKAGKDLNAHYVLFGSARERDKESQITMRLVQTASGEEVWSDRYRLNTETDKVIAVEDKISFSVASRVDTQIAVSERARAMRKASDELDGWDMFMRARWHFFQYSEEDDAAAIALCEEAIRKIPNFSYPHALLAQIALRSNFFEWGDSETDLYALSVKHARDAVTLDPDSSFAHESLSRAYLFAGRTAIAIQEAETSISLNPYCSGAYWSLGMALAWAGRPAEAVPPIDISLTIDPFDQGLAFKLVVKASALLLLGQVQKAEALARQATDAGHGQIVGNMILALALSRDDRIAEAQEAVKQILLRRPGFTASKMSTMLTGLKPLVRAYVVERFVELGLPE